MEFTVQFRWNGELRDPESEQAYRDDASPTDMKIIRIACLVTGLAYLGGGLANYNQLGWTQPFHMMLALRLAAASGAAACIWASYRPLLRKQLDRLLLLYFMVLVSGDVMELVLTPLHDLAEVPGLTVVVIVYYLFYPTRLHLMMIGGISALVLYCGGIGLIHGTRLPYFYNSLLAFILVNAFGAFHVATMNRSHRQRFLALRAQRRLNEQLKTEIAERKKAEQKLFEQATTDELTGACNRRFFLESGKKEFCRAKRHGHGIALIMFDLDHFKAINDTHGHEAGDEVLRTVARVIRQDLRTEDLFGRVGGEEFAILLPASDGREAMGVAERIRENVANAVINCNEAAIRVTISLGVAAVVPQTDGHDLARLLKSADMALYAAKNIGRNRTVMAD